MNLANCLRSCCWTGSKELSYALSFEEKEYFSNISRFRNDLPGIIGTSYIAYKHEHSDVYVHTTTKEGAGAILRSRCLSRGFFGENGGVGRAIYTFPAKSGRCYTNDDKVILMFESDLPHYHIVGSNDTIHSLGECIFLQDNVVVRNCKILSEEDYTKYIKDNFNPVKSLVHYFGVSKNEIEENNCSELRFEELSTAVGKLWENANFTFDFYNLFRKDFKADKYEEILNECHGRTELEKTSLF